MKSRIKYIDSLSNKQIEAMNKEIIKQILERDDEFSKICDSVILLALHEYFGFGEKRLKKFYESYFLERKSMKDRYEMDQEDMQWLYDKKLKSIGVDLEKWRIEIKEKEGVGQP